MNMELLAQMREAVQDVKDHAHTREDFFCLNLLGWLGERTWVLLGHIDEQAAVIADRDATIARLTAELAEARLLQSPFPDQSRRMGDREIADREPRSVGEPIPDARIAKIWANVNKLAKDVTRVTGSPEREETYIRFLPELRGITARQPESGAPMAFTLIDGTEFVWAAGNLPWSIKKGTRPNV